MSLLLREKMPLRTTQDLGDFATAVPLKHCYGVLSNARFPLDRMTDTKWFVCDHPFTVEQVFVNDTVTEGWEQATESDGKGNTWTVVNLSNAANTDDRISATGLGKKNPVTGELLSNAAEIIEDFERIAGRETLGWSQLRAESSGIQLAGVMSVIQTIRAQFDEVTTSAAAIWSPGMSRLYPISTVNGLLKRLRKDQVNTLVATADLTDTADILKLSYDFNYATGSPQRFIQFETSPQRFDGIELDLTLPWLRKPTDAEVIGRRLLRRLAGKRLSITFNTTDLSIHEGDWVLLVDLPDWPFPMDGDPTVMVIQADNTPGQNTVAVTAEAILDDPLINITAHTVAIPSTSSGGADVVYQNGVATFTFTVPGGQPAKGARVSVDGGIPKTTDDQGKVGFTLAVGPHTVAVEAIGFTPMQFTVDLQ